MHEGTRYGRPRKDLSFERNIREKAYLNNFVVAGFDPSVSHRCLGAEDRNYNEPSSLCCRISMELIRSIEMIWHVFEANISFDRSLNSINIDGKKFPLIESMLDIHQIDVTTLLGQRRRGARVLILKQRTRSFRWEEPLEEMKDRETQSTIQINQLKPNRRQIHS